jgi:tRNA threonylcarbamoyl adenosine modification protein (Sua5/YciO/YrdC/YwlC family)
MILKVYPENPAPKHIRQIIQVLNSGGVIIFPTDTVYALGCSLYQNRAVDTISKIKGVKKEKNNFSIIINNLSMLSEYTKPFENHIFRLIKKNLPGPFTFILNANSKVPKIFQSKKRTIGIRMPDNAIVEAIIDELGHPLLTTSIRDDDKVIEYTTDPELIYERYKDKVDLVVNGGYGDNEASTVVDCTSGTPEILRQGKGILME